MQNERQKLIHELAKECTSVEEVHEKLRDIFKDTLQQVFEAEIDAHLGYSKNDNAGDNTGNSRNGYYPKTVKSRFGETEVRVPRDRNGAYEPKIVKKYETTSNQLEEQIIAMYAKGMSTRDIEDHMKDIYGVEVSATSVSKITDKILPLIAEWQSRPLDRVYPIVFLDAIHFKVRKDNRIINKAAYSVLGINPDGHKDVLGICRMHGDGSLASFLLIPQASLQNESWFFMPQNSSVIRAGIVSDSLASGVVGLGAWQNPAEAREPSPCLL